MLNKLNITTVWVVGVIACTLLGLASILTTSAKDAYQAQHPAIDWNQVNVTKELSEKGEVVIIYVRDSIVCYKLLDNE